jgi:hypothetical protein
VAYFIDVVSIIISLAKNCFAKVMVELRTNSSDFSLIGEFVNRFGI